MDIDDLEGIEDLETAAKEAEEHLTKLEKQEEEAHELLDIIKRGDLEELKKRVKNGLDPNESLRLDSFVVGNDKSLLQHAARHGQNEICKWLIENGANIGHPYFGALWTAACGDNVSTFQLIWDHMPDLNPDRALMAAARAGGAKVCKWLLDEKGADLEFTDGLTSAVYGGSIDVFKLFFERGLKIKDSEDLEYVLHSAISDDYMDLFYWFVNNYAKTPEDYTNALTLSLDYSDLFHDAKPSEGFMRFLLKHGANINGNDAYARPLFCAIKIKDPEIIRFLLNSGADINLCDSNGRTPIEYAIKMDADEKTKDLLIEYGANPNVRPAEEIPDNGKPWWRHELKDPTGADADMWKAIKSNDAKALRKALESGASVLAESDFGDLPMIMTANNIELLKILMEFGGDINCKDYYNCTPLSRCDSPETCQALIDLGADVNLLDEDDVSVFMYKLILGRRDICEVLVKNGADINLRDKHGNTAYRHAANNGLRDMCEWYLSIGGIK